MKRHSVAVLMATYNGEQFLSEQIESLAQQESVNLTLFISDDFSTDRSLALVNNLCTRLKIDYKILPQNKKFGGAAKNFFRLINDVEPSPFQYFAFADQDDIWVADKLANSIREIQAGADAVSSNVTAFWPDLGQKKILVKSQPQRTFDYLFESAGPGCTFVLSAPLFIRLQELIHTHKAAFDRCALHDWAIYAVARGLGYRWKIMSESTVLYRQHSGNVVGAHKGLRAAAKRFFLLREGWVFEQVQAILNLVERCCPCLDIAAIKMATSQPSLRNKIKLCLMARDLRRQFADRCVTMLLFASGLFWPRRDILQQRRSAR